MVLFVGSFATTGSEELTIRFQSWSTIRHEPWKSVPQRSNAWLRMGNKIFRWLSVGRRSWHVCNEWHAGLSSSGPSLSGSIVSFNVDDERRCRELTVPTNRWSFTRRSFSMELWRSLSVTSIDMPYRIREQKLISRMNIILKREMWTEWSHSGMKETLRVRQCFTELDAQVNTWRGPSVVQPTDNGRFARDALGWWQ